MGRNSKYPSESHVRLNKKKKHETKNVSESRPPQHKQANMDSSQISRASRNGNLIAYHPATDTSNMDIAMSNMATDDGFELIEAEYDHRHTPPSYTTQSTDTSVTIRGRHNGATDPIGFPYYPAATRNALTRNALQWHDRTLEETTYVSVDSWVLRGDGSRGRVGGTRARRQRSETYSNRANDSHYQSTIVSSVIGGDYLPAEESRATEYIVGTGAIFDEPINPIVYQSTDLDI